MIFKKYFGVYLKWKWEIGILKYLYEILNVDIIIFWNLKLFGYIDFVNMKLIYMNIYVREYVMN